MIIFRLIFTAVLIYTLWWLGDKNWLTGALIMASLAAEFKEKGS